MKFTFSRSAIFTLAIAAFLTGSVCSAEDDVLLEDSFEQGKSSPEGWHQRGSVPGVKYVYDQKRGKSGERSLSLQKSAKRYFPIAEWMHRIPLKETPSGVSVSCQVRTEKATKAIIDVQFLDANGDFSHEWVSYIGAKESGDPPPTHDWKEYSGTVEIPKGTKQLAIALQIYGPGKVWFDDLVVRTSDGKPATSAAKPIEIAVGDATGEYLFVPAKAKPEQGGGLLIVLPGGNGSADFHPFVKRIHNNSLPEDFALAQPIAKKWTDDQFVVWPTASSKSAEIKFTTEELIASVIEHVEKETKLDPKQIFLLAWSSGGPAAYATLLQEKTKVTGAFIAMSVYKPDQYPAASNAKDRRVYLLHSPDDRTCPYWMAKAAKNELSNAGVKTTLVDYEGGHGWRGNVFGMIRDGVQWLVKP